MSADRKLLVVDDEEVVCRACRRIFSKQGFDVEVNTDARQGLMRATEQDYELILLDIKMPNMNGIEFLEGLRQKKPEAPVLIITGYPSIPNAAAAMRLGACDYITKPFTAEEITWAVQRVLSTHRPPADEGEAGADGDGGQAAADIEEKLFWDESWVELAADASGCVGAVLPGLRGASITGVRLPRIGEVVYQGLPMASVTVADKPALLIPSPLSGVVAEVNELLAKHSRLLTGDPCGEGWIACVCSTRHEELAKCKPRSILLVNMEPRSAEEQARKLRRLGCHVACVADPGALTTALAESGDRVVFLDSVSLAGDGPALVERINHQAPRARIVVVGSTGDTQEGAYRKHKIFFYAVEPFSDNEIADILAGLFRTHDGPASPAEGQKGTSEPISSISITNRNLRKVQLLAAPGLLWSNEGLGHQISEKLLANLFPVVVTPGENHLTPANILKAAGNCDRVMVLLARDSGLLPGGLARDTKPDFEAGSVQPGGAVGKVTTLSVQPDAFGGVACLDARTIAALAEHIVWDMSSY